MKNELAQEIQTAITKNDYSDLKGDGDLVLQINKLFALLREKVDLEDRLNELGLKTIDNNHLIHLMCHDLRNPLGTSISFLELSQDEAKEAGLEIPFLEEIQVGLQFSLKVIENVQSLMALNSGKLSIDLEYVKLADIVSESVAMIRTRFKDKDVRIEVDVSDELIVLTHKTYAILSVFNNLLSNALKFSPQSGVVEVRAHRDQQMVLCHVIDHGIGMPAQILENLFEMNKATNRSGTSGEQGTGFGMTLVKRFMEAFEGQVYIESQEEGDNTGTIAKLQFWSKL